MHTTAGLSRSTHLLLVGPTRLWTHLLHAVGIVRCSWHCRNVETTSSSGSTWWEYLSHLLALCTINREKLENMASIEVGLAALA